MYVVCSCSAYDMICCVMRAWLFPMCCFLPLPHVTSTQHVLRSVSAPWFILVNSCVACMRCSVSRIWSVQPCLGQKRHNNMNDIYVTLGSPPANSCWNYCCFCSVACLWLWPALPLSHGLSKSQIQTTIKLACPHKQGRSTFTIAIDQRQSKQQRVHIVEEPLAERTGVSGNKETTVVLDRSWLVPETFYLAKIVSARMPQHILKLHVRPSKMAL